MIFEVFDQPISFDATLREGYTIFNYFFICEALFKIAILGITNYMSSNWNRFDFFIVLTSIVDIYISSLSSSSSTLLQILKIIKMFRVLRLLKIVKNIKGIQRLV